MVQAINSFTVYQTPKKVIDSSQDKNTTDSKDQTAKSRDDKPDSFVSASGQDPNAKTKCSGKSNEDPEMAALAQELGYDSPKALQQAIDSGAISQDAVDKKLTEMESGSDGDTSTANTTATTTSPGTSSAQGTSKKV